jgi:hypothetical protein
MRHYLGSHPIVSKSSLCSPFVPAFWWWCLVITGLLFEGHSLAAADSYRLRIPLSTSADGIAEVYYDLGDGFKPRQKSYQQVKASKTMQPLDFELPSGIEIKRLRFDPLNGAGTFSIGSAEVIKPDGGRLKTISADSYVAYRQLQVISHSSTAFMVEAPPGSSDPILLITLAHPLILEPQDWPPWIDWFLIGLSTIVTLTTIIHGPKKHEQTLSAIAPGNPKLVWMDRLAQKLSDPQLIVFDRVSVLILGLSAAIFVAFVLLGWHGSSTGRWDLTIAGEKPSNGLIWGEPKAIRNDELTVFTPDIFSQVFSRNRFAARNPVIGGEKSVLFWSWPVKHFIEIPRFHLWPFHVLSIDRAFSAYWNLKGLILFAGVYLLLLLLTGSRSLLAAAGTIWIYFSGIVQWWYSHCLPECIGFACLALLAGLYLVLTRKRALLLLAAPLFVVSLLDFILIFYPAYCVPVMWAILSAGVGILIEKRRLLLGPDPLKIRWVVLAGCIAVCGVIIAGFISDTRKTIEMILATGYPGHRFYTGGTGTLMTLFLSFLDPVFTESHIPQFIGNVCEGSGIYLGGLLVLPMIFFAPSGGPRYSAVDFTLAVAAIGMSIFILVGFPHFLAGVTLLSMTALNRAKAGLGLCAAFLLIRHFARHESAFQRIKAVHWHVALPVAALLGVLFAQFLQTTAYVMPMSTCLMLITVNFVLVLFIIAGRPGPFFAVFLPFLLMHNFLINPIAKGFSAVTEKNLYRGVRQVCNSDPAAKWVVFGWPEIANFLKFAGADVINGNKFYPVFRYNNILDPKHRFLAIWNNYGHVVFVEDPLCERAVYKQLSLLAYQVRISASSASLDQIGVRYCIMTNPPPTSYQSAVLKQIRDGSRNYWILRRDLIP